MKNINKFILEKLKINSKTKVSNSDSLDYKINTFLESASKYNGKITWYEFILFLEDNGCKDYGNASNNYYILYNEKEKCGAYFECFDTSYTMLKDEIEEIQILDEIKFKKIMSQQ